MSTEMILYRGNTVKLPASVPASTELIRAPAYGAGKAYIEDKRPKTLQDELDDFLYNDVPIRPRIESKPEPEAFAVNRPGESKPAKPEPSPPKPKVNKPVEPEPDLELSRFHHICWDDDEVTLSNMKIGTSGRDKTITVTLSTSNSYRFARLLEQIEQAMPTKAKPASKATSRRPPARR